MTWLDAAIPGDNRGSSTSYELPERKYLQKSTTGKKLNPPKKRKKNRTEDVMGQEQLNIT